MKKINFELVFKIIVLIQLTSILLIVLLRENSQAIESNEIGRYKEIRVENPGGFGGVDYKILILDTKTGETNSIN